MPPRPSAQMSPLSWRARIVFWTSAVIVGLAAVAFAEGTDLAIEWQERVIAHSRWWMLLLAPLGLAAVAWLTRVLFPGSQGSGIPQAIAALQLPPGASRRGLLSPWIAIGKMLLTMLALACGASVGREGPTVHVGAALMHAVGRWAKFPRVYMERSLILAGGAAGISAAFNTPVAGIVFAIEEMARSFEERTTGTLLTAVIIAGIVATAFLGNYAYFGEASTHLPDLAAWAAVPACGLLGGLLGGLFSRFLIETNKRLAPLRSAKPVRVAALLGVVVVLVGLVSQGTSYGSGYHEARHLLTGDAEVTAFFPLFKIVATMASYLSGIPGGLFSPSLSTGAGIGADLAPFIPSAPVAALVILGMVGYLTGVVQTPLTASVIVMEMVNDHDMILPIMATAFIALGTSKLICRAPVYRALAVAFLPAAAPEKPEPKPEAGTQAAPPPDQK